MRNTGLLGIISWKSLLPFLLLGVMATSLQAGTDDPGTITEDCEDFTFEDIEDVTEIPLCDEEEAVIDDAAPCWSVLPPVIAIVMALVFRQVLFALFAGIWIGAWLVGGAGLTGIVTAFFATATDYIVPSIADPSHVSILVFSMFIGGMVGIIGANGGTRGIVKAITRLVTNRSRAQVTTTLMGYIVFFDDYANTMVVGSTMRPLTDRLRISRAKLAYLVDSTAAPVAIVAIISTWIGAVIGYITEAGSGITGFDQSAYFVFLNALPYNFYAFLAILFVAIIAFSGRDFGPMRRAEQNALDGNDTTGVKETSDMDDSEMDDSDTDDSELDDSELDDSEVETTKTETTKTETHRFTSHWLNAALPIVGLVIVTLAGLWITGEGSSLQQIVGSSDSYAALVWGSVLSLFLAIVLTMSQRLITTEKMLKGMFRGMNLMFEGLIILVLAWSLGLVTQDLNTATYLVSLLEGILDPFWIPVLIFILAGFTSFATGSSWGTMGILTPLVLPLTWTLSESVGLSPADTNMLIYSSVSAVLAGAVWGDHCSPISDTTILSSLACQCDHVSHVNTQLPYALTVGGLSVVAIIASTVVGIPLWLIYPAAIAAMIFIIYRFGKLPKQTTSTL